MTTTQDQTTAKGIALELAEFADASFDAGLPDDARHLVRRQLMDSVGVAIAGESSSSVDSVRQVVEAWDGSGRARAVGEGTRRPASHAAFIGGTKAHALDFDDTHFPSVLHPSASVVHAALAVADELGSEYGATLDAIGLGNELVVRLGMAGFDADLGNSIFFENGLHATSICGAVGSALATGLLRGLDPAGIASAIGISCSFGAGLLEANRSGGSVKQLHCGWAAFAGTTASDLASAGITGPTNVIEGRFGFLRAYCGERGDVEALTAELGQHWEIANIGFKPYPTNAFTHSVIDAGIELRSAGVRLADIESVSVLLPEAVLRTVAEPKGEKARPATAYSAKFSAPFVFALAIKGGGGLGISIDDLTEAAVVDADLLRVSELVEVSEDPALTAAFPAAVPTIVRVRTVDGRSMEVSVDAARGSVGDPLSDEDLRAKFITNVTGRDGPEHAEQLAEVVDGLELDRPVSLVLDYAEPADRSDADRQEVRA